MTKFDDIIAYVSQIGLVDCILLHHMNEACRKQAFILNKLWKYELSEI